MPSAAVPRLHRLLPIISWLPKCSGDTLRADFVAGLALGALLIPEAMAYAGIAGLAPQAGLFAAAFGLFTYALFGSSRHLAVAATSGSAAMLAALVAPLAQGDAARYAMLASATAVAAGVLLWLGYFFKLGFVSEFIAKPVLKGFVFGIAVTIIVKQAPKLLGIHHGSGSFFEQLWNLLTSLTHFNPWTLAVGVSALVITFGLGAVAPRVPSALVVFIGGIVASKYLGLEQHGVEVVGLIQGGVPHFTLPAIGPDAWPDVFAGAVGIVLIMYAEALAAGRTFGAKFKYDVDANQELAALATANLASGFFQGFVVGGGMSGTAANASGGARTQLSTIITSVLTLITVAYLTPLFRDLPEAVLGAIVIHAVAHLADVAELRRFARLRTGAIYSALTALAGVLALGILKGLLLAICLTLVALMKKLTSPQESMLGRIPGTQTFADIKRYPEAQPIPGLLIYRPNGVVFFANVNRIMANLRQAIAQAPAPLRAVILNLEAVSETDVTSLDLLEQLRADLQESGVRLVLARVTDPVLEFLARSGFTARLGEENIRHHVASAVDSCAVS
ncbi:MAG: sulfate permease [Acidobacteria bacterium]|nr:sulfate permease [Acidobacteriota bacterium]